ncbi:E2F transcription factor-like [Trifolium repens]|nr:E2F transcription factor-like [Trifolium repens]
MKDNNGCGGVVFSELIKLLLKEPGEKAVKHKSRNSSSQKSDAGPTTIITEHVVRDATWKGVFLKRKSLALLTQNFVKLFVCSNLEMICLDDAARLLLGDAYNSSTMRRVLNLLNITAAI